jgi:uncharacterized membrane protein YdjX (TVP38/TMEM64 family)
MTTPPPTPRPPSRAKLWLGVALLAGLFVAFRLLPVAQWLDEARATIAQFGPWGPVAFVALYAVATVLAMPAVVLTVAAGPMFGPGVGLAAVSVGSILGASAAFAVARWVARDRIAARVGASAGGNGNGNATGLFARLDRMVESHGWIVVAITRLVPIFPFNLLNYAFGLTRIRFATYVWASWLFMLPGTALYVLGGDAVLKGLAGGKLSPGLIAGLVAALLVVVVAGRRAKSWLDRAEDAPGLDRADEARGLEHAAGAPKRDA